MQFGSIPSLSEQILPSALRNPIEPRLEFLDSSTPSVQVKSACSSRLLTMLPSSACWSSRTRWRLQALH
ncbi:hypothetical protein A8M77_33260 [Variovorax sp. JS1663]|nr:hypothetical protein A8M77_33260 [Variovorax sp. JS1663]